MTFFDEEFKTKLRETISEIENASQIEVVAGVRKSSDDYADIPWKTGVLFSLLTFTFFMFSPLVFGDYTFYLGTLAGFAVGFAAGIFMKNLRRLLIGSDRAKKVCETAAAAIFHRNGLSFTKARIGTLVYLSLDEKRAAVIFDRGAAGSLPDAVIERFSEQLQTVFDQSEPAASFLAVLLQFKDDFSLHIPSVPNDINELPDDLIL